METNRAKWERRHRQGKTKLDVAIEAQISADAASISETIAKAEQKKRKIIVDAAAEAAEVGQIKANRNQVRNAEAVAEQERLRAARNDVEGYVDVENPAYVKDSTLDNDYDVEVDNSNRIT